MRRSEVNEKVAYLQGLVDGQDIQDAAQKKLFGAIIDALGAIAKTLEDHEETIDDIDESIVDIYEELDGLQDNPFDDDDFLEISCPHCGETVYFDYDMLEDENVICPACNADIDILGELSKGEDDE